MSGIFISYRREDSAGWAGRLAGLLRGSFRADELFMDIHTIEPGMDFIEALSKRLRTCDVLLAVIGPHWLSAQDRTGRPRLHDPNDYVRLEIATALQRNIRVIPVLVGGATMPTVADLPDELGTLVRRQAYELSDTRWDYDSNRLVGILEQVLGKPASQRSQPQEPAVEVANPATAWFPWFLAISISAIFYVFKQYIAPRGSGGWVGRFIGPGLLTMILLWVNLTGIIILRNIMQNKANVSWGWALTAIGASGILALLFIRGILHEFSGLR
jgi:TIR domain